MPPESVTPPSATKAPSVLKAAGLIAAVTLVAKAMGALRDWQIFHVYGASLATDAYFAATQIPAYALVLLGGLGGPFHTLTVRLLALITPTDNADTPTSHSAQQTVIHQLHGMTLLVFGVASLALWAFAPQVMQTLLPGAAPSLVTLATEHLRWMARMVVFGGMIGISYGVLNVYHVYLWPSLAPAVMSALLMVMLWLGPKDAGGVILAWSTTLGAIAQWGLQLPSMLRLKFTPFRATILPQWDKAFWRQVGELLIPLMIGTTIGQLITMVDMSFVRHLDEGGWSAIVLSNRLLQLPIGVLQTALLVPIFPRFTQAAARNDTAQIQRDTVLGISLLWLVCVPLLVVLWCFAGPLISVLFEGGQFDATDTRLVTLALVFQAFQMLPYFARDTITRIFYAYGDTMTPVWVGLIAIGLKFCLNWLLVQRFGLGGITLATTLITFINAVVLWVWLRKHIKLQVGALLTEGLRLGLAAAGMAATLFGLQQVWTLPVSGAKLALLLSVAGMSGVGLGVFLGLAWLLRSSGIGQLQQRLIKK